MLIALFALFHCLDSFVYIPASSITTVLIIVDVDQHHIHLLALDPDVLAATRKGHWTL
jgi:hypothetical protein